MKRKLLLLVMFLCITNFTISQTIELIGKGTIGATNANLGLTDIDNITKVEVGAVFKDRSTPTATTVLFNDADEGPMSLWKDDVLIKHFSTPTNTIGYFASSFTTADAGGINMVSMDPENVHSFYAYVYRNDPNATVKSFINTQTTFYYRNGSTDAYVYDIPIDTATESRDVTVKIPITELDAGSRIAVIDIIVGDMSQHDEINTFNLGNSFFLGEYTFEDVPGNVSNIAVSIYSPNDLAGEDNGDSFFVNGIVADVEIVEEDPGCTLTKGYWKTHTKYDGDKYDKTWAAIEPDGEDSSFYLSGHSYYQTLKKAPRGNPYYILAHQYIAAKLNFLNGADPSDAKEAFEKATLLFERYTPYQIALLKYKRSKWAKRLKRKFIKLAKTLDEYNNGTIGPGHCDDGEEEEDPCLTKEDVKVTPNPITSHGKITFKAKHPGRTVVYLYNSYGRFICPLYAENVKEDQEIEVNFNARYLRNGIYYIKVWNGCCMVIKRIAVQC